MRNNNNNNNNNNNANKRVQHQQIKHVQVSSTDMIRGWKVQE
jgi:hypothetical protein